MATKDEEEKRREKSVFLPHVRVLRGPRDHHERSVLKRLHMHERAKVVQFVRERRLCLVPHDLRVGTQVLYVGSALAVPVLRESCRLGPRERVREREWVGPEGLALNLLSKIAVIIQTG